MTEDEARERLNAATDRRVRAAQSFLEHVRGLRPFSEFEEAVRLKAEIDASDSAWHAAYDEWARLVDAQARGFA